MSSFGNYLQSQVKEHKQTYRRLCNEWSCYQNPEPDRRHLAILSKLAGHPLVRGASIGGDDPRVMRARRVEAHRQYSFWLTIQHRYEISLMQMAVKRKEKQLRRLRRKNPQTPITMGSEKRDAI